MVFPSNPDDVREFEFKARVDVDLKRIVKLVRENRDFFGASEGDSAIKRAADMLDMLVHASKAG